MAQQFIPRQVVQQHSGSRITSFLGEARWIGRWIMGAASVRMVLTIILYPDQIQKIINLGSMNSGVTDSDLGKVVWSLLYSFPLLIIGQMIDRDEKRGHFLPYQETMISMLFLMILLGIIFMPVSGFWMMVPAIVGLIAKNKAANERY